MQRHQEVHIAGRRLVSSNNGAEQPQVASATILCGTYESFTKLEDAVPEARGSKVQVTQEMRDGTFGPDNA